MKVIVVSEGQVWKFRGQRNIKRLCGTTAVTSPYSLQSESLSENRKAIKKLPHEKIILMMQKNIT